jgi:hypothetical protein
MFANIEQYRQAFLEALEAVPHGDHVFIRAKGSDAAIVEVPRKVAADCIARQSHVLATASDMELREKQLAARRMQHEIDEKRRADSAGFRVVVNNVAVPAADVTVEKPDAKAKK